MGIYTERKIGGWTCAFILAAAFAALYGVWLYVGPELERSEVIFAAAAAELSPRNPLLMTIHGWATPECMPLLPLVTRLLCDLTGIPIESALRGLSILMLGAGAVTVYLEASNRRSAEAGVVAAAMYSSCFLALGTAVEGTPATANAFFLGTAQLIFFRYGIRQADWNRAWIYSALLLTLGFLSGGFMVLLLFVFPMFFFRRPLSSGSKFRRPGFVAAIVVVVLVALLWFVSFSSLPRQISPYDMWVRRLAVVSLWRGLLTFPFGVVFWLLPWSLIAWIPFCVALQSLDDTPTYSQYLRTLVLSSLALLWLLPETGRYGLFCAFLPLSVLTGRFYELGMRRFGIKLRRFMLVLEIFMAAAVLLIAVGYFLPEGWIRFPGFISVDLTLAFRRRPYFWIWEAAIMASALLLAFYVHWKRFTEPVWVMILSASVAAALFFNGLLFPYKSQAVSDREFGRKLGKAVPEKRRVYTDNVRNLNSGLVYSGVPVYRLGPGESFPITEKEVYLLSLDFPQFAGYSGWSEIGDGFIHNKRRFRLWKGRKDDKSATEDKPGEN